MTPEAHVNVQPPGEYSSWYTVTLAGQGVHASAPTLSGALKMLAAIVENREKPEAEAS